jgi:hypothetical protein
MYTQDITAERGQVHNSTATKIESSPFGIAGPRLVEKGYCPIPIMQTAPLEKDRKRPGHRGHGLEKWREFEHKAPTADQIRDWSHPRARNGVGVALGGQYCLKAVDTDTDDPEIVAAINSVISPSPVTKRGAKGSTGFYQGPDWPPEKVLWKKDGKVILEILGSGQQTIIAPTIHATTGEPYRWIGTSSLEDVAPSDLPVLSNVIERLDEVLAALGCVRTGQRQQHEAPAQGRDRPRHTDPTGDRWRDLNNIALANLSAWVPALGLYKCHAARGGYEAVAHWRSSNTGQSLERRDPNLKIHPSGIMDFGDDRGYSPIDLVEVARGVDKFAAFDWLKERVDPDQHAVDIDAMGAALKTKMDAPKMGVPKMQSVSKYETLDEAMAVAKEGDVIVMSHEATDRTIINYTAMPFADAWLGRGAVAVLDPTPPTLKQLSVRRDNGILYDIGRWMCETAPVIDPVKAMMAAQVVVGTLIGRKVMGPTFSGTHIYYVLLAKSGEGKDHYRECIGTLLRAAGAGTLVGRDSFMSESAARLSLIKSPVQVSVQDEFSATLKKMNTSNNVHDQGLSRVIRAAWGLSFKTMPPPEWAGDNKMLAVPIESPALSMFCISTPDEFFAALSGENVSGGLINRFLVIEPNDGIEQHQWKELNVPRELVEKLKLLRNGGYQLGAVGNECGCLWDSERKSYSSQGPMPPLVKLLWADEDAVMSWAIFKENMKARRAEDPTLDIYLKRTAEYAVRLATIRAVAQAGSGDTSVDMSDLASAIQWACPAAEQLARWAQERMNHDDHKFSDQWKKIVELVTSFQSKNGGAAMPHSICLNKSRYTAKVFKEVVGTLAAIIHDLTRFLDVC